MPENSRYEQCLKDIVLADERFLVLTAENRASLRCLPTVLQKRFIDTGITEQALVGVAAGLALRGRVPVVHALAAFLTMRAFEFIRTDVGLAGLPVKLVGGVPGFLSTANGPTHQAVEDVGLMCLIPSMQVFCPADEEDLAAGLRAILESPGPCYIRYNSLPAPVSHAPFRIGQAETLLEGSDVSILSYGTLVTQAVEAVRCLEREGVSASLVNLRMLKPLDEAAVLNSARRTGLLVTLEDHLGSGGLYAMVSEIFVRHRLSVSVLPLALREYFEPGFLPQALHRSGFSGRQIARRILEWLGGKSC